ncbi:MAG: tyrosine--tRNA ligase, partial [Candidatus Baldrarchaeia archaeon]
DIAPRVGRKKPIAVHTPLLSGLTGVGRMDIAGKTKEEVLLDTKMSKSLPETCIFVHDSPEDIRKKIRQAYCPPKDVAFNPVMEINKYLLFARDGFTLEIHRPEKYGGDLVVESYSELEQLYLKGELHPLDLKNATADALIEFLKPVREYFEKNTEAKKLLEKMKVIKKTR